jgi:hypothetical protein
MAEKRPYRTWRMGTETFTITDAHPYHRPIGKIDHKGAGEYEIAYDPHCPLCRKEQAHDQR